MDNERNIALQALRPKIKTEFWNELEMERFQNEVLRPILKFQSDLIVRYTLSDLYTTVKDFKTIRPRNQVQYIENWFSQKQAFKSGIISLIVALMTDEEFITYVKSKKEINKRINTMSQIRVIESYPSFLKEEL
jgi:hypothetical protein